LLPAARANDHLVCVGYPVKYITSLIVITFNLGLCP
jgi:hypothetical protein